MIRVQHVANGHLPYASWCSACVKAKGRDHMHRRLDPEDTRGELPTVAVDFCFLRQKEQLVSIPTLALRDSHYKETRSHSLPTKGVQQKQGGYIVDCIVKDLDALAFKKIVFKTDQEPAMKALQAQVKAAWSGEVIPQYAQRKQSASNGMIEQAVQDIEGQVRVLKIALEQRLARRLPPEADILTWLIDYAGVCLSRCNVSKLDNKTPRERRLGKRDDVPFYEFGESVLYLPMDRKEDGKLVKLNDKFHEAIWVGIADESNEYLVASQRHACG